MLLLIAMNGMFLCKTVSSSSIQIVQRSMLLLVLIFAMVGQCNGVTSGSDLDLRALDETKGFQILGTAANEQSGYSVSGGGDVNGDSISDILVGSIAAGGGSGMVYVVFGRGSGSYPDIDFNSMVSGPDVGFRIIGASGGAGRVSIVGDVNGDAIDDILVGAKGISAVYVIFGQDSSVFGSVADVLLSQFITGPTKGFLIIGILVGASSGTPPDAMGSISRAGAGIVYVIFGRNVVGGTGIAPFDNVDLAFLDGSDSAGFRILGAETGASLGQVVAGAGDVNGDSFADVIVSSYGLSIDGRTSCGSSYVIFGRSAGLGGSSYSTIDLFFAGPLFYRIDGASAGDYSGFSVSGVGDVNKDGIDDVIVGAYGADPPTTPARANAGISYVLYGRHNTIPGAATNILLSAVVPGSLLGFRILGATAGSASGTVVSAAGDINNDGVADVIAGAYWADPPTLPANSDAGITYVIFGRNVAGGAPAFGDVDLKTITTGSTAGFKILGAAIGDWSSSALSAAGDVNGDGIEDIVIGAVFGDPSTLAADSDAGISYVIFGAQSDPTSQPSSLPSGQPSSQPIARPSAQPSGQPSSRPTTQPSTSPSAQPSSQPSSRPSAEPSALPTVQPSSQPTSVPSAQPTCQPSSVPSRQLSAVPSAQPSSLPSCQPLSQPTLQPSSSPSAGPTTQPSEQPSSRPSGQPSSLPSSQPSSRPTTQPSTRPTAQPSVHPSAQPSSSPSSQPSMRPTSQPSARPTAQPSLQPTAAPSAQPSGQPSSSPSAQPSVVPSAQPSEQPSAAPSSQPSPSPSASPSVCPSSQPSVTPTAQPYSEPTTQPSSAPTVEPSTRPSAQPSALPSTQPSAEPSVTPTASVNEDAEGEWATPVTEASPLRHLAVIGGQVWACGVNVGQITSPCALLDSFDGRLSTMYRFPWKSLVSPPFSGTTLGGSVVVSGFTVDSHSTTSDVANCAVWNVHLLCDVTSFSDAYFLTSSYLPYPNRILYIGTYNVYVSATVIDITPDTVRSFIYTLFNMKAVVLSQVQSPPNFIGSFVAGTAVRSAGAPVNYIIAGMLRTDTGGLSAMALSPVTGDIVDSTDLVTSTALEITGPDLFMVGVLELSNGMGKHAYLVRANALYSTIAYCVRYRTSDQAQSEMRRALTSAGATPSVARGVALAGGDLFVLVERTVSNITSVSVLKTTASNGEVIKQVRISVPQKNLHCTDIVAAGSFLAIACVLQHTTTSFRSVVIAVDRELTFSVLPEGFVRDTSDLFLSETVPFKRTIVSVTTTTTRIATRNYQFNTADQAPSLRPSVTPSSQPSSQPSSAPSAQPNSSPTAAPSVSARPTSQPSTASPTNTHKPSVVPTTKPSAAPSVTRTTSPSARPTLSPTARPSSKPSVPPSAPPTTDPSVRPTRSPTIAPSRAPRIAPFAPPVRMPSVSPTVAPTGESDSGGDGDDNSTVIWSSVGGALLLCACGYLFYQYRIHIIEEEARAKRKVEYFAHQEKLVAALEKEREEMIQQIRLEDARKEKNRKKQRAKAAAGAGMGAGAFATGPVRPPSPLNLPSYPIYTLSPSPTPLNIRSRATSPSRSRSSSVGSSTSSSDYNISSMHTSEMDFDEPERE